MLAMKQANSAFWQVLFAAVGAMLLPSCTPNFDAGMADMRDLKQWQAAARNAAVHDVPAHDKARQDQPNRPDAAAEKLAATRIAATRDPFAPLLPDTSQSGKADAVQKNTANVEEPATPHLLGTVHNMSFSVKDIELRALLQTFARFDNTNIVASDSVKGNITVELRNLTWQQALDVVLQSKGLAARRIGQVLWIAPQEELARRQQLDQTLAAAQVQQAALQGELFQLNYQKAETLRKLLHIGDDGRSKPNAASSLLSARGSAIVDARTNQLLITDTAEALKRVRTLIRKIDIASRQVLIQAYIVEANHQFSRNLGVRLGFATGNHGATTATPDGQPAADPHRNAGALDLPARALTGMNAGQLALSLFNPSAGRFLSLELSALEADGQGRIVSSPRVVTADQQAALIEQGEEIPYQQAAGQGVTSTSFKKANLKLQVTPQITPDDQIILNVDINKDSRGMATPGGLAINTKHIKTQVQVENDGTVVIGGIYTETVSDSKTQVPLLGDLPILGNLFKSTGRLHDKTELLIFLTPKIVGDLELGG
jgi:type IV pilus assembly protein PilQ